MENFRELQPRERELIHELLKPVFPGRDELLQQLETARVRVVDDDGSIAFDISSNVKADHVKYRIPTEGEYEDSDGITVHVLLHIVGDKAEEIEFYKEDNSRVMTWPCPSSLRVFAPE